MFVSCLLGQTRSCKDMNTNQGFGRGKTAYYSHMSASTAEHTHLRSQTCSRRSVPLDARIVSLCGDHWTWRHEEKWAKTWLWDKVWPCRASYKKKEACNSLKQLCFCRMQGEEKLPAHYDKKKKKRNRKNNIYFTTQSLFLDKIQYQTCDNMAMWTQKHSHQGPLLAEQWQQLQSCLRPTDLWQTQVNNVSGARKLYRNASTGGENVSHWRGTSD